MMKIGFSSSTCPGWDLEKIVVSAASYGFDGVELRGLAGELHLPIAPQISSDPAGVRDFLNKNNVELVCLGTSESLDTRDRAQLARRKEAIVEYIELANELGCPFVRLFAGEVQPRDHRRAALSRIGEALGTLSGIAGRHGVTLLVENGGDFLSSDDLWFLIDHAQHPAVQCCWNQCNAMCLGERATKSLPRLAATLGMVHLCDADFDESGVMLDHKPLGEGQTEVARQVELLRGLAFHGYLIFEWPKMWVDDLPAPDAVLPEAASYLQERIGEKQDVLTAYKGDKRAPLYR